MHPKIGDLVEIKTGRGLVYAQYTHKHKMYGALLRIVPGFYLERPKEISMLPIDETRFVTFFPLSAALKQGIVVSVGNFAVPDNAKKFPLFRCGTPDKKTKTVLSWWLWDGEREWSVGQLNEEQLKLPIRGVWNDTLLIKRLESDWLPEKNSW